MAISMIMMMIVIMIIMYIWIYGYIYIYIYIYICMYVCIQYFPQFLSVEFFLREAQGRPIDWDGCNWNERAQDLKVMGRIGNSFSGLGKCQIFVGDDILNSWVMFS